MAGTQHLITTPHTEVWEECKRGVEYPGHRQVKTAMETNPAVLRQNHTDGCHHCQNSSRKNSQTRWRCKGTGAPSPNRHRQPTPEPTPPRPRTPPEPSSDNAGAPSSQIDNLPPGYVVSHTPLPCNQFFNLDAYAQYSQHHTDFNPDMLTDEGISTG